MKTLFKLSFEYRARSCLRRQVDGEEHCSQKGPLKKDTINSLFTKGQTAHYLISLQCFPRIPSQGIWHIIFFQINA